jgi:hypothetical protein
VTLNWAFVDQYIGESREQGAVSRLSGEATFGDCSTARSTGDCAGTVQNWKDISPRVGFAMDLFGNGRTAIKASWARYVAGQAIAFANQVNPIGALTGTDTRAWRDLDGNGLPLDNAGNIQFGELTNSAATPTFRERADEHRSGVLRVGQARLQLGVPSQPSIRSRPACR